MHARVLYISYDGLLDPLGQSQVLPYIRELARRGVRLRAISFEKSERASETNMAAVRAELDSAGVEWHPLRYHRSPRVPATLWDIMRGTRKARSLLRGEPVEIIHARSYIASLMAVKARERNRQKFLFDMRGFWPDERVDGGSWRQDGAIYRAVKKLERKLLAEADGIVSLTHRGKELLESEMLPPVRNDLPAIYVIPTCADLEQFKPVHRLPARREGVRLVYLGSLGSWYLPEQMLCFFESLLEEAPGSSFRLLTNSDRATVERAIDRSGIGEQAREAVSFGSVPHDQVPEVLAAADCTIFFIRPSYSKQASCATKFAESLACGVPVVINSGVGDHDRHLEGKRAGVVLGELTEPAYRAAAAELLALLKDKSLPARCRELAENGFSLSGAVDRYLELYGRLKAGGDV